MGLADKLQEEYNNRKATTTPAKDDRIDAISNGLAVPRAAKWSWRCFFGIHHWGKWSAERPMFGPYGVDKPIHLGQDRHCINCNRIESRSSI